MHTPLFYHSAERLFYTKENLQASVNAGEAHKGEGKESGSDKHDGYALHALRDVNQRHLLAKTSEHRQSQSETDGRREGIDHALQQREVFLDNEDGHTEYSTVGGYQRQEDTQCLIKGGRHFLQDNLHHLHQGGDDEDEHNGLQVLEPKGIKYELRDKMILLTNIALMKINIYSIIASIRIYYFLILLTIATRKPSVMKAPGGSTNISML